MAGFGWHSSSAGPGVEVSTDKQTLTRPTDGGGGSYASARGSAGRKKGRRYFEVDVGASCSVGIVDINADLDALLGNGASPSQWGFSLQNGYFYYRDSGTNGSSDKGTGAVAASVIGVLVDFDANTLTLYDDGVELFTESISFAVDTVLYPAASIGTGDSAALNTQEPFQYPPAATHIPWDKSDLALGSKVSGTIQIEGAPAERMVKAFSYERLPMAINNQPMTESKPLGQSISDPITGEYEIILREGFNRGVIVFAFDDYGDDFEPDAAVTVGDRVHPTTPTGYVYECTGAGDLPSTEPDPWPTDTEASHSIGTASFDVKPFYRPEAHGPVTPKALDVTVNERPFQQVIGAKDYSSAAVQADGTVVGWASNNYGVATPPALSNILQVAVAERCAFALDTDGYIHAWGTTAAYDLDEIPAAAQGRTIQIAAGMQNAAALLDDGTVMVWGANSYSQVSSQPVITNAVQVAVGRDNYFVVKADGTVVAWGRDVHGILNVPSAIQGQVIQVSPSSYEYHALALLADGTVAGWGHNDHGQRNIPSGLSDVIQVSAGHSYSYALKRDGSLVSWGRNHQGQRNTPGGLPAIARISTAYLTTVAVATDGSVYAWGYDAHGESTPPPGLSALVPLGPIE